MAAPGLGVQDVRHFGLAARPYSPSSGCTCTESRWEVKISFTSSGKFAISQIPRLADGPFRIRKPGPQWVLPHTLSRREGVRRMALPMTYEFLTMNSWMRSRPRFRFCMEAA